MLVLWRLAATAAVLALRPHFASAFFEEIFSQAFGGQGGGGFEFHTMGGDGFGGFQQIGGMPRAPKFPRGVTEKISKKFSWLKGTEWNWNRWRNVKFQKDGTFEAPTRDCQRGQCRWSASKNKVHILWGEAGLHNIQIVGDMPVEQNQAKMAGLEMRGVRVSDGEPCSAAFVKVFDFEAAELDKDLYEILGLPDDVDEAEMKKAYRKLSIKYHPDKVGNDPEAQKKFAAIRDAYEILNDPEKKILYDTGGMEAVKEAEKGQVQKGEDIGVDLAVTLEQLYNSGKHTTSIQRRVVCRGCRKKPDSPKCQGCGRCPNEIKLVNQQVGPGMVIQQQQEVASKEKCKQESTKIEVPLEKGMKEGDRIPFARMSEQKPGTVPGSVIFTLKQSKHRRFVRRGDDLHMNVQVSLREALLGWTQRIRHMDGHIVTFSTESVTRPFQVIRIKGEGMPLRDDPATFGDLLLKVEVVMPSRPLSQEQRGQVESLLHPVPARPEL